jgi:hypothetical protein
MGTDRAQGGLSILSHAASAPFVAVLAELRALTTELRALTTELRVLGTYAAYAAHAG